jgi:hypothetical protein
VTAKSRGPAVTTPAGSRTTLTVIAASAAAGAIAGWSAFYGVDRIRFLSGATTHELRRAGWRHNHERRAAA